MQEVEVIFVLPIFFLQFPGCKQQCHTEEQSCESKSKPELVSLLIEFELFAVVERELQVLMVVRVTQL